MEKKKEKSPYKNFTLEEVMTAESNSYVIQIGEDFFSYEGDYTFSKNGAEHYYDQILNGLNDLLENGDETEKEDAFKSLLLLKVYPLRIH